jgi:hypothetical protein
MTLSSFIHIGCPTGAGDRSGRPEEREAYARCRTGMRAVRLSLVTKVVVFVGVAVGGLAVIQPWLASAGGRFVVDMLVGLYGWTFLYCLAQFVAISWWSRSSLPRRGRAPRCSSDATWYLPVYVWGMESNINVVNATAGDGWVCMVAVQQGAMLLVTLGLCLGAEAWARRGGCAARATQGALPLSVVAAIIGVEMPWLLFAIPTTHSR